jgi:CDGSH-type Zn-finger protein
MEHITVENLQNSKGELLSTIRGVVLCRCGASKNKPFCDGTHATIGFSGKNREAKAPPSDGSKMNIIKDNRKICSHAAECVNNLPSVFRLNSRPWIDPDGASSEEIIDSIRKCPSGALSYSVDGVEYRDQGERKPMVTVSRDGPYVIIGGVEIIGDTIQFAEESSTEHYTLCRCGASENKPFCDGMHKAINFKDDKN